MSSSIERGRLESQLEEWAKVLRQGTILEAHLDCAQKNEILQEVSWKVVAEKIIVYCEQNRRWFAKDPSLIDRVQGEIFSILTEKLEGRFSDVLNEARVRLSFLVFPVEKKVLFSDYASPQLLCLNERLSEDLEISLSARLEMCKIIDAINQAENSGAFLIEGESIKRGFSKTFQVNIRSLAAWRIQKLPAPLKILFLSDSCRHLEKVVLVSRKIVGRGAERVVRKCFDLKQRVYYVRKKITTDFERKVIQALLGLAGIVPCILEPNKLRMLEPLYDGSLPCFWEKGCDWRLTEKISLMTGLLKGLESIHGTVLQNPPWHVFQRLGWKEEVQYPQEVRLAHLDIKPGNILVRKNCATFEWEAVLCDFGFAGSPGAVGSPGYRPPEFLRFLDVCRQCHQNFLRIASYQIKSGPSRDIWALGLVFASLLSSQRPKRFPVDFPSLPSIENRISVEMGNGRRQRCSDDFVKEVTQSMIAQDIDYLRQASRSSEESKNRQMDQIWLLIEAMLEIDPEKRTITAKKALDLLTSIK